MGQVQSGSWPSYLGALGKATRRLGTHRPAIGNGRSLQVGEEGNVLGAIPQHLGFRVLGFRGLGFRSAKTRQSEACEILVAASCTQQNSSRITDIVADQTKCESQSRKMRGDDEDDFATTTRMSIMTSLQLHQHYACLRHYLHQQDHACLMTPSLAVMVGNHR